MKKLFCGIFFLFLGVLQAQDWQVNYNEALALAKEENKPIILVFSGSDWCAPCIRLKRHILDSEEFKDYAASHYILYNADFPRRKKNQLPEELMNTNKSLAEKYNPKGHFPLVVVLDNQESVLGEAGFYAKPSPEEYLALLNSFVE
ncbi:thioredoxin family protein [Flagellimonas nanhaiensis]|uniref:Thioredoxin family protein n=1 Tax=Flagellimonas nanhaiensis TaxID=2292706 RepID=A0A371JVZ0_9FLAO|nr:thioredoxin family protein [Allomuricauda nanhaiensis]RDY61991.1 thioredoxin family protein [Allomuricauda nanhaiensis]